MTAPSYSVCFLIGSARSGTTWLSTILDAHPEIYCTEHRLFGRHFDVVHDGPQSPARVRITLQSYCDSLATCCNLRALGEGAHDALERALTRSLFDFDHERSGAPRIVDKITPYVGTARDVATGIATSFPDAPILQLMRDPRDVVVSGAMHWLGRWTGDRPTGEHERRGRWLLEGDASCAPDRLLTDGEIEDWSQAWSEARRAVELLSKSTRVHAMRYESLLDDPRSVVTQLFEWLGVRCDAEIVDKATERSSFTAMSGGRSRGDARPGEHIRNGTAGDWRNWLTRSDGELLWRRLGDAMIAESYASDDGWIDDLPTALSPETPNRSGAPV